MTEQAFQSAVSNGAFDGMHMPPRVVVLPWPDKVLSPNARCHWSRKAKATKAAREAAYWLTWQEVGRNMRWKGARLAVTFSPPDKRRRDRDNLQASLKAHFDGISDALGINDSLFVPTYAIGEPVKGGAVRIEIRPI
jgi:crossover junction endodeoxyribonuclease RusA